MADGKVGIGTTAPSNELEVNGDIELTNLFDNDASNFFDGGCSSSTSLTGIDSTGAITCTAITGVPASAVSFENITSGTNTTAAMVVGAGASLNYTSTGTINASSLIGGTWAIPGTIGSTTPNTGAFTTLSSTGTTTLGDAIGDAVTINAGAWTFANDTNFALTGGVNGLSFDGTTFSVDGLNNRIGIGTAAPTDTLEVNGGILGSYFLDHSNTAYGIDPANTTAFGNSISMQISGGALLALDEGRVGIGVASPAEILDVGGNATVSGNLTFTGATSTIANRLMQNLTIGDSQTGNIVLANNVTLTTGSVTSSVVDSSTAMGFTLNTTSLTTQGAKLLSLQNAGTEKFYIDKDGNLYAAGTILSGNGTSMLLTNKSGGIVASKAIVVLDTSNNTSFTTTTTPYSKAGFGVVVGVGLGVTNDADGDGVCDANDICMVAYAGSVNVTVKNATTAAKGEYLFTSDTAGSAVASAKQYDGLVGIVDDTTNAASGYLKMIFKVQPQVTAAASIDKGTKHNEYWLYADQYKETGEGSDTDTNLLARGLMFDTLSDSTKTDSANTTASLNTAVQKTGLIGGQTLATSTTDNAGNTYLGSNTVNKVFYYDRTSPGVSPGSPGVGRVGDSSPQVQVELGIDPNWYNGVTLSVATTSAQFSQNSTITKPNPNLSTSYNGSLIKVTGTDTTPRTIYITIKSPTTFDWTNYQGDSATGVTITPGTAQTLGTTGVSANFTDARYNTGDVFKIASWFIEPSSSTRGAKQQFPERSYVIATASSVDIIDADTQKLWMRFSQGTSYAIGVDANNDPSSANMLNGKAYISTNGSSATGLYTLDFVHDAVFKQNATDYRLSDTAIYGRNGTNTYNVINTSNILVNITANDVSSAVIPNQPTQNVTVSGWGYTYVVAGAASSESVNLPYKFNDIPRVSVNTIGITSTAPTSLSNCGSNPSNYLFAGMSPTNSSFSVFGNITSGTISGTYYYCYSWTATGQVSPRTYVAAATDAGVTVVNETDSTAYSYSDVTGDDYNSVQLTTTGKMYALNETQAILEKWRDIASNTSSETNGTPDKWWGETAADVLLDRDFTNYTGSTYVLSAKATHNGAAARAISQNFDIAGSGTTPVTAIKVIADQAGVSGTASMEVRSGSVTLTTAVGDDAYTLGTSAVTGGVATNTYDMSAVSAGQTLTFNFSGLTLTKGSTYTFILYTSTDNGTTGMSLKVGNTDYGSYRRSVNMYHADNGWDNLTSWYGTGGTTDLAFQVLKNNVTIPVLTASIPTIPTNPSLSVTEKTSPMGPNSDTIYVGTNQGVSVIQDKESDSTANDGTDETNGSVKYYTKDYISEEMVGDIRGMWPLNNANSSSDFEDVSVKANTLTGTNITAAGDSVSGVRGTATDFDGSTESLTIADDADLDFAASEKFTVGLWNKHNGAISTNFDYLMTKADATTGGYKLYMDDSGDYCFTIDDDSSWTPDDSACTSGIDYDDSNWHYVQGVKDATTGIYLYVDGKLVASDTSIAATGTLANTNAFYIGVDRDGTSNEWDGYIDEPFVTATALSAGQIRHMYQVGYRALQSHATTLGGGAADTNQQLGMISTGTNTVGDARVDYNNQFMYVGTNSTTLGAVSKIDLNSDTNIKTYNSSANVPTGGALLIDEDTKSLAVGYNLEAVGSATGGVKTMGVDNNAMATSGNFIGKTVTTAESFTQAYLWAQYTLDSSDASNTITVSASNDGGSNYSQCNLTNTDTSQSPTEYEYFCQFNTAGSSLKTKFAFARGSTKTNTYVTRYGIAWIGSDAIAGAPGGNGLYTNNNASVANGSYIDVAHNQNSNDVVTNGWWYNTTTSKWEAIDGNNNSDIDLMEYSTNATAQAAYVTNGGASADVATGGTATASLETEPASEAFDDVIIPPLGLLKVLIMIATGLCLTHNLGLAGVLLLK
ncbi:MAG: hypothetical protein UX47_C0015G0005 [Candidatus Collierbacteria bacterium GW2011_GWA2_46_26]|uniref:LamG-like jellyroll fold domain-containing protein n=1 Tax=Candidatus Collierbacteria bacterium GW2011_GWA2_46_26 TaxID=1618381 RepID=A0A0G1SG10_9BACT|nr:MAG: hypothetical protein UX47_C0015G0005 [Candidatus Collierbacteria bacterium GW2011_GWA2_46_26]